MQASKINEIKLIFLLALALLVFISLFTFNENDIKFLTSNPNAAKANIAGFIGAYIAWILRFLMGLGSYAVAFFIALWGGMAFLEKKPEKPYLRLFGAIFFILAASSILSLTGLEDSIYRFEKGGMVGLFFSDFLLKYLGTAGTFIAITLLLMLSVLITTDFLILPLLGWLTGLSKNVLKSAKNMRFIAGFYFF